MSIEQKIAELLAESKKLQAEEINVEGLTAEQFNALTEEEQAEYELDEAASCYKKKAMKEEVEEVKEEITVDVSEDVAALINGEELTEEFKTKAATIFEAAVLTRVKAEVAKIEEQFESKLAEQVEEVKEGLVEKVDGYLNYVVEQWMTDNELALENGMKTDIMESFIAGMKTLFQEHYIEVPAEKYDLVGELEEEVETTKSKLDEQLASNVELTKQINEMKRVSSIGEFCADLADTDAEKFKGLAEELAYEDADSFKTKLQTIKENYFGKKATVDVKSPVSDEPVHLEEDTKTVDPVMAQYLAALK
jgi:methyltransferase-like protein